MGGRGIPARRPLAPGARTKPPFGSVPTKADSPPANIPAGGVKSAESESSSGRGEAKVVHVAKPSQEEFGFGEVESRGHFEKTDRNLFDGQDLDVPTYLRRGIKISL